MSQQAAAGRGAGRGRGRKPRYFPRKGGGNLGPAKAYESPITEIAKYTFNTGENKFAAQFTDSRERVAGYIQRSGMDESYLVAETIRTGTAQTIALPGPVDANAPDKADLEIIRMEVVKSVAKRRQKLEDSLKKGYATVYDQCSQDVRDKLKATKDWERVQAEQSLDELIKRIERICVGFDDHKQSVFNLVQSLKALFLYSQSERETVEEFSRNFKSLWETVEAFGGSPGTHQGLVDAELGKRGLTNPNDAELQAAESATVEQVKAALLISGADRRKFGRLKDELANDYLLGTDHYPNTLEKAARILSNYQSTNVNAPYRPSPNDTGVAFLQRAGRGGKGGRGGAAGQGTKNEGGGPNEGGSGGDDVSAITGRTGGDSVKTNSKGESHCFNCGSPRHWAYECPQLSSEQQSQLHMNLEAQEESGQEPAEEGQQLFNVTLAQGGELPDNRVYLDGCSTVTAFKNDKFLKNIKTEARALKINCNAGAISTNRRGECGNLKVWYLPEGIANIISMHELESLYRITYDSWAGYYVVHTPEGEVRFYKDEQGLPYLDLEESSEAGTLLLMRRQGETCDRDKGLSMVQTVRGNYEGYTKREVLRAKEARRAQAMMGNPSEKDYGGMVSNNMIPNCPVARSDIANAKAIFGPDLPSVRGKTVRRAPAPVVADYVAVPRELVEANKVTTLAADVFFVDGTAFLLTVARRIKFVTGEHLPTRTAASLSKHMRRVLDVYQRAGFRVRTILMDGEFEKLKPLMPQVECNTTAAKEHVSEAERTIRTLKERVRGLLTTLPFTHIPRRMKIEFIYFIVLWMNAFPVKSGISQTFSPRELLVRWRLDYKKHCRVLPGTYCEVHDEPVPTNTMTARTHEAIALGPTGNLQGSVKFYCLNTGRVLKRRSFTPMPMPDSVIERVNKIGERERQGRAFRFTNRRGEPYDWTDEVPEDDPDFQGLLDDSEGTAVYPDVSAEMPGVELESEEHGYQTVTDEPAPDFRDLAGAALHNAGIDADVLIRNARGEQVQMTGPAVVEADEDELVYELTFDLPDAGLPNAQINAVGDMGEDRRDDESAVVMTGDDEGRRYPTRARRTVIGNQPYDAYAPRATFLQLGTVRAHRSVVEAINNARMTTEDRLLAMTATTSTESEPAFVDDVTHRVDRLMCTTSEEELGVMAYLLTQYNLKPGLRKFGKKGEMAALKEMTQLHIMDTWTPLEAQKLSREQRMRALSSLLFLKEKRTGDVKGRACINGAPQRAYIAKEDAASPTVSTESTFITAAIAAKERRKVRCYDVPSAFVNTEVDEEVLMVLKGELADMMVQIAPETYRRYVTVDKKGKSVLYVRLQKALYGLMRASLLFYRKLRKEFERYGLVVNPYDPCVANMETESGKQLTVVWHVDDLLGSCEDDFELTKFSCYMAGIYGPKLSMHMGKKHDYLGVTMEFCDDGALEVSMVDYLKNVLDEFPERIQGRAATPAHDKLFVVRDDKEAKKLSEEQAVAFHHTVAQLLFMATRARRDIQTAVAFLTTRVKNPDQDDWGKLKRVLKYLNGTKYLKLRLTVDNLAMLKWYVDGSHNVHWDCKGHGGAVFSLGRGATSSYSRKLKLNTRSSTETELVAADMFMPEMLWSLHFIQAQGYEAECVGLYQDNISTQLLIKNGKMSSGKKTKHIKAKFFFIKDRVDSGEITVIDCPAEGMWADVMTKPLQGTAFRVMRAELMNCEVNYEDPPEEDELNPSANRKSVSWKSVIATTFKTPQECVGGNGDAKRTRRTDTTRHPGGILRRDLGVARLRDLDTTWRGRTTARRVGKE